MAQGGTTNFGKRGAVAAPRLAVHARPAAEPVSVAPPHPALRFAGRLPWLTFTLGIFLAGRFAAELRGATDYAAPHAPGYFSLLAMGASDRIHVVTQGELWRLFTAPVLHGSPAHLVGNLVSLVVVGFLLEPMVGLGWFACLYFTGAFAGAVFSVLLNPADVLSVGASGAIMALLAALLALSFHSGAARPGLMRRVAAGSLFPALIPSLAGNGATVDINAHFGGMVAGIVIAFLILIVWREEDESPPGRSIAAVLAGLWLALTAWAFTAALERQADYARPGLDYIPPDKLPRNIEAMQADSYALVERYPRDPRTHLFRGLYFLEHQKVSDAEPYFRTALRLGARSPVMTRDYRDWTTVLLALSVGAQRRNDESRRIVAPLCAATDLDARTQQTLKLTRLCSF